VPPEESSHIPELPSATSPEAVLVVRVVVTTGGWLVHAAATTAAPMVTQSLV
jgi:hypothetical protein